MKSRLSENGVLALYNTPTTPAKVQVLYLAHWNMVSFLRVTDSNHLSPIMVIMKMNEKFIVGDIILIQKVTLQPSSQFKDEEIKPIIDSDLNHIVILEYQVIEKKGKFGILFTLPNSNLVENAYWTSLLFVKNSLIKEDSMADSFFKEGEKRLQLLRPDCNLLRERGNELFKRQNYCKAILHYDMAKQKDHYDARVWNNSSQAYFFNSEFNKARRDALVALKLDPFNKKAYFRAGRAMEKAGDINGALEVIEAGLYVCGKCEDLEKLLKQIKGKKQGEDTKMETLKRENVKPETTKLENSTSTNPLPKKKISHSTVNETVTDMTSSLNSKKIITMKESLVKKATEIDEMHEAKVDIINDTLKLNKTTPTSSFLIGAKMLYEKGKYKDSLELFQVANTTWTNNNNQKEIEILRYLIDVCKFKLKIQPIEDIKNSFASLLSKNGFPYPPALHFWLANVYEYLENQDKVNHHANTCLQFLENGSNVNCLCWPGTNEIIQETSPDELKKWFTQGSWRSSPVAKCRHIDCIATQNTSLAKTEIYVSDLDFRGYVEVECEEFCSICYHPCCWKFIKENCENGQLGKKTDKDFLGLQCFTPDCTGKISSIRIFDETSHLRNEIAKDKKKKHLSTAKLKKKKDKKKSASQFGKIEDRRKIKINDTEDFLFENEVSIIKEDMSGSSKKIEPEKPWSQVGEHMNFSDDNFKVLHPADDYDEFLLQSIKKIKNSNKKKKKGKQVSQINIGDDVEDRFVPNEYLTRLRALRAQREALESDASHHSQSADVIGLKYLPECILDPEKPFYLPEHLQENPDQLESFLRVKMATTSSSDIDKKAIANLLEFMYDWLKANGPMLITDSRIKDYISENFPTNAVAYVNNCGGVRSFLLQSFRFALIDEVVCVNEQVLIAQESAIHIVFEKFKISKFNISDGHKAVKFSHLLDDTKSTCSSNSSFSTNVGATGSGTSCKLPDNNISAAVKASGSLVSPTTSYKNAALGKIYQKNSETNSDSPVVVTSVSRTIDTTTNLNKPNDITIKRNQNEKLSRKSKLKTMDIDAFEDLIETGEMGQLFNTQPTNITNLKSPKSSTSTVREDILFHSDDEHDAESPTLQGSKKLNESEIIELKERLSLLESELGLKNEEIVRIEEENKRLTCDSQEMNDRLSQIKKKSSVEIAEWKKSTIDAREETKMLKTEYDSYRTQKEGELRKLQAEKSRLQEELKACTMKMDSLQLTIDQLNANNEHLDKECSQSKLQLASHQMRLIKYQDSTDILNERARDAELKYLSMKKDLINMNLEKTKKRLTAEINKMNELLMDATEETKPSKSFLLTCIAEWNDTIVKLSNSLQTVSKDGNKLHELIQMGRPLCDLPPGDLQIPSVPDLTVAHLLFVGKPTSDGKAQEKIIPSTSGMSYMGQSVFATPIAGSQFSGLASGGSFSPGQLGVTPTHTPTMSHLDDDGFKDQTLRPSMGLSEHRSGPHISVPIRFGMPSNPQVPARSTGFTINGVTTGISGLTRDKFNKDGSTNSSPNPVPMATTASPSPLSGASDFTPSFLTTKPPTVTDHNQIFVGQLPWNFTEDHLKPITYGSHTLNIQAKEIKRPSKVIAPNPAPNTFGPVQDVPLISTPSSSSILNRGGGGGSGGQLNSSLDSAFGLQSLLEASSRAEPTRTIATPTTPTASKPKFQNLRSNNTMGAIGTIPPKVVRPTPRPGTAATGSLASGLQTMMKEDSKTNSASYKRLTEACKQKFGNEYSHDLIQKAIFEVREQNRNSLSGLPMETIIDQVETQLRIQKRVPSKAPWAQGPHTDVMDAHWPGPVRRLDSISEDQCAICLEIMNIGSTQELGCQHCFHSHCIAAWLKQNSVCPMCRQFAINNDEYPSLSHG